MPDFVGRSGPAYRAALLVRSEKAPALAARRQPAQPLDLADEVQIEPHPGWHGSPPKSRSETFVPVWLISPGRKPAASRGGSPRPGRPWCAAHGWKLSPSATATRRPSTSRQAAASWLRQLIPGTAATRAHGVTGCTCACRGWHFPLVRKPLTSNVCVWRLPDLPAICGSPATLRSHSPRISMRVDSFTP